ncbi:hypothetical protein LEP1GSC124_0467, partial [Leptospira interrogans serovar Pyrogenes str. 200701872]
MKKSFKFTGLFWEKCLRDCPGTNSKMSIKP